jgi:hypothetical protein
MSEMAVANLSSVMGRRGLGLTASFGNTSLQLHSQYGM